MQKVLITVVACVALASTLSAQVVINEISTGATDWIEVCNLDPVNSAFIGDWGLAYFEDTQAPGGVVFRFPSGITLAPLECCVVTDDATLATPAVPAGTQVFNFGANILWNPGEAGSLLLFDAFANGIDYYAHGNPNQFLAPFEGSSFIFPTPPAGALTAYTGPAAPLYGGVGGTEFPNTEDNFFRHSRVDTDTATDWTMRPETDPVSMTLNTTPGALNPFQNQFDVDGMPPVAIIEASTTAGASPLQVTFTNASQGDCELTSVLWDFDATANPFANTSAEHNAIFTFTVPMGTPPGTTVNFDVTLALTDNCGGFVTSMPLTISVSTPNNIVSQVAPYEENFEGPIDPVTGTSMSAANGWELELLSPTSRIRTGDPRTFGAPAGYVDASVATGPSAVVLDSSINSNFATQAIVLHIDAETIFASDSAFRIQVRLAENLDEVHPQDVIAFQDGITAGDGVDNQGFSTGAPGKDGFQEVFLLDWQGALGVVGNTAQWGLFEFTIDANFLMTNGLAAPGSGLLGDCRLIIRHNDNFMFDGGDGLLVDAVRILPSLAATGGQTATPQALFDISNSAENINGHPVQSVPAGFPQDGPHFVTLTGGDPLVFQFVGDAQQKVILLGSSQLNPGAFDFTPLGLPGQLDIGTPTLTDLFLIFNGDDQQSIPNLFFETDAAGSLEVAFTIPVSVTGVTLPMQAFMRTAATPFLALTNAIELTIQ